MTPADLRRFFTAAHPALFRRGAALAVLVFAADQLVKYVFLFRAGFLNCAPCPEDVSPCLPCASVEVLPFLNFVMVWNRGVSFGLFAAETEIWRWVLTVFSVAVSAALLIWLARTSQWILAAAIALVVGGALGNAVDRAIYGAVADFFHFHAFGYSWYVFNIADAAIVLGVMAMIADAFFAAPAASGQPAPAAPDNAGTEKRK